MTKQLGYVLSAVLVLVGPRAHAADGALPPPPDGCVEFFDPEAARSSLKESGLLQYEALDVKPESGFAGYMVIPVGPSGYYSHPLGRLKHHSGVWPREEWRIKRGVFHFFDVGHIHLAADAASVNAYVTAQMIKPDRPLLHLENSDERRRDLLRLHRFRDEFAGSDAHLQSSHVDTMGVSGCRLEWDASRPTIRRAMPVSAQIHYGVHADYIVPSVNGLLEYLQFEESKKIPLPALGPSAGAGPAGIAWFDREFRGRHVCQLTLPLRGLSILPEVVRAKLLFKIFQRFEQRGCSLLVAVLPEAETAVLARYGFTTRPWCPGRKRPRWLSFIDVRTAIFEDIYNRLQEVIPGREAPPW